MRCLLLALLLLAPALPVSASAPPQVEIPVGHIGDRAAYEGSTTANGALVLGTLVVEGISKANDSRGGLHDTVRVSWTYNDSHQQDVVDIDRSSRDPVRLRHDGARTNEIQQDVRSGFAILGPVHPDELVPPAPFGLFLQGETLDPARDLTPLVLAGARDSCDTQARYFMGELVGVDARAQTDITAAPRVREQMACDIVVPGAQADSRVKVSVEGIQTFGAGAPYPDLVLQWRNVTMDPPVVGHEGWMTPRVVTWKLVTFSPGEISIPWLPRQASTYPAQRAGPRGPVGTTGPTDGGTGWPLTLQEARDAAVSDPSLVRFALWKMQNPDPRLVGARLEDPCMYASQGGCPVRWELTFASPGGTTAFVLSSTIVNGRIVSSDTDPSAVRELPPNLRLREGDLPATGLTIAEMQRLWRVLAAPPPGAAVTGFAWGLGWIDMLTDPAPGVPGSQVAASPSRSAALRLVLRSVMLQHVDAATGALNGQRLIINVEDGSTIFVWDGGIGLVPTAGSADLRKGEPAAGYVGPEVAAVTLVAMLLALIAYFAPLLRFWITAFTRLRRETVLDHHLRDALVAIVRAAPGVTPPRLQDATRAGWSTIVYHLRVLEREGVLVSILDGRHKRFFVAGQHAASLIPTLAILSNDQTRAVYEHILARPGSTRQDVADAFGWTGPGAAFHLTRLQRSGLVDRAGTRRKAGYVARQPSPTIRDRIHARDAA